MEMASEQTIRRLAAQAAKGKGKGGDLGALADRVLALQTSDKFRLVALLLDAGLPDLGQTVAQRAIDEIQISALFGTRGSV
jgi:hypothetical protein